MLGAALRIQLLEYNEDDWREAGKLGAAGLVVNEAEK